MQKQSSKSEVIDQIDVEELLKDFKILNIDSFAVYLKEVWRVKYLFILFRILPRDQMTKPKE